MCAAEFVERVAQVLEDRRGFAEAGNGGGDGPEHWVAQLQDSAGGHNIMKITAKAPCRVDLAGGTIDIWPLYLFHRNAVTVNFAVNRYASCVLETHEGAGITIRSRDLATEESFGSLEELRAARRYKLPLAACVIRYFAPQQGFDLLTDSEAP